MIGWQSNCVHAAKSMSSASCSAFLITGCDRPAANTPNPDRKSA